MIIIWIILVAAIVGLFFSLAGVFTLARTGIPAVPSSFRRIRWFLDQHLLPTSGTLIDLGCGDARFLIEAKKRFPNLRCVGYELNPWDLVRARVNSARAGVKIELHATDFFQADFSEVTVVYCYLLDSLLPRVEQLLEKNLPTGVVVVAHAFPFPNWKPSATLLSPDDVRGPFYVYNR